MYLSRLVIPGFETESTIDRLLNQAELDLVQLDYAPPLVGQIESGEVGSDQSGPSEFLKYMRDVHRSMFLRPELRVVTDAGGGAVVAFMESLAKFFVEHGSGDMPMAAIRGENLLPDLEELLLNSQELKASRVLSAQAEIGAAPLLTALVDGARLIVAGAYDSAAPFVAAAVSEKFCNWGEMEKLAPVAAASQFEGVCTEIDSEAGIELEQSASEQLTRVREHKTVKHADMVCDYSNLVLEPGRGNAYRIGNVSAVPADGLWNVRLTVDGGFRALMLIDTVTNGVSRVRDFCLAHLPAKIEISEYLPAESPASARQRVLQVNFIGDSAAGCQASVDALQLWLRREFGREAACTFHSVQQVTEAISAAVPSGRIVLSVDTRPAREWI